MPISQENVSHFSRFLLKEKSISLGRMYLRGQRKHARPYKVYIFFISTTKKISLVHLSVYHIQTTFHGDPKSYRPQILHRRADYVRTECFLSSSSKHRFLHNYLLSTRRTQKTVSFVFWYIAPFPNKSPRKLNF